MKMKYEYKKTLHGCAEIFVKMQDFKVTDIEMSLNFL